eukprot:TRINITY_DN7370_c0_g1_i1.p1 TRINITY_DN7370_c0_g1~~TRINITY_DN7370_c0_g1_i1.p1  ORF type:complete len:515 (+),score=82.41 TRINITY_DN7370_c0_g1_i1:60-1547(+)
MDPTDTLGVLLLSGGGTPRVCPTPSSVQSFKAARQRKTQAFIQAHKSWEQKTGEQHRRLDLGSGEVDPRLLDDADTPEVLTRVAAAIHGHYEDGERRSLNGGKSPDAEFDEVRFLLQRSFCCIPRRPRGCALTKNNVRVLLEDVSGGLYFCKQIIVLCLVYIERLLEVGTTDKHYRIRLTSGNWRSLVVAALLISSKVWEDVHPWNTDFEKCLLDVAGMRFAVGGLYRLESCFLNRIGWRTLVTGEMYAAYFFTLVQARVPGGVGDSGSPQGDKQVPRRRRTLGDEYDIIEEEEEEEETFDTPVASDLAMSPLRRSCTDDSQRENTPRCNMIRATSGPSLHRVPSAGSVSTTEATESRLLRSVPYSGVLTAQAIHEAWRLDCSNPHIGSLRHAPQALAPSKFIQQSLKLRTAHEIALLTSDQMLPMQRCRHVRKGNSAATLSGATGSMLANEMRTYLDQKKDRNGNDDSTAGGSVATSRAVPKAHRGIPMDLFAG